MYWEINLMSGYTECKIESEKLKRIMSRMHGETRVSDLIVAPVSIISVEIRFDWMFGLMLSLNF